MKILAFGLGLLILSLPVFGQRTQTINADCLRIQDGNCVDKDEFGALDGVTSGIQGQIDGILTNTSNVDNTADLDKPISTDTQDALDLKANDAEVVHQTGDETILGVKTFEGKIVSSSTSSGSHPCPSMTDAEMLAIATLANGDCVHNTTLNSWLVYDLTEAKWEEVGSGGGVSQWETATEYEINSVVIESNKLYIALTDHVSGTFATDLTNGEWQLLNSSADLSSDVSGVLPMANGGTEKALTPTLGGVVYTDAASMEVLEPGTPGQVLQTNGAAAPTFVNKSISGKAGENTSVTLEEVQTPHNQLTETETNKHNIETGNPNKLTNPSFEHLTDGFGWSTSVTSTATATITTESPSHFKEGNKSGILTCEGGASGGTCLFYQDVPSIEIQGLVKALLQADASGVKFYTRVNGSNNLSKDVGTISSLYKIPQVMGDTTTGIGVEVTVSASQTINVKIDEAFVGAQNLLTEVTTCDGSLECETEFKTNVTNDSIVGNVTIDDEGDKWISSISSSTLDTKAARRFTFKAGVFNEAPGCRVQSSTFFGAIPDVSATSSYVDVSFVNSSGVERYPDFFLECSKTGTDYQKARATSPGFSTTNADTDWQSCGHTTSDFTGFGTVTNIETQCKRQGSDLLMRGRFTSGAAAATEARVALRFKGQALSSQGASTIPALQMIGSGGRSDAQNSYSILIEPSVSYFTIGQYGDGTRFALTKQNANILAGSGTVFSFFARIPIEGWENSNVIIASLEEVPTVPGLNNARFCGATVSNAGAISNEWGDCFDGNFSDGSGSGSYAVVFNSVFSTFAECGATAKRTDSFPSIRVVSVSTSGATIQAGAATPFSVWCWGK